MPDLENDRTCHICQLSSFNKRSIYKHLAEEHKIIITDPNSIPRKKTTPPTPKKKFYADTARSIKTKENIIYWKSVMVSEGKLLFEFANGKLGKESSCGAEAYAILKAIYYFIENGIAKTERVYLHSDNLGVIRVLNNQEHKDKDKKNFWDKNNSHFLKYIYCIKKLVKENDLKVKFKWVKGSLNPADYYSRKNGQQYWKNKKDLIF